MAAAREEVEVVEETGTATALVLPRPSRVASIVILSTIVLAAAVRAVVVVCALLLLLCALRGKFRDRTSLLTLGCTDGSSSSLVADPHCDGNVCVDVDLESGKERIPVEAAARVAAGFGLRDRGGRGG